MLEWGLSKLFKICILQHMLERNHTCGNHVLLQLHQDKCWLKVPDPNEQIDDKNSNLFPCLFKEVKSDIEEQSSQSTLSGLKKRILLIPVYFRLMKRKSDTESQSIYRLKKRKEIYPNPLKPKSEKDKAAEA